MLNRTNRTLSAHLNRLNLGTRSLALVSVNGKNFLRLRHAHGFAMRAEMLGSSAPPIAIGTIPPQISGSFPPAPWPVVAVVVRPSVVRPVLLDSSERDTEAALAACSSDTQAFLSQAWSSRPACPAFPASTVKRRALGKNAGAYRATTATTTAAATVAAAGG